MTEAGSTDDANTHVHACTHAHLQRKIHKLSSLFDVTFFQRRAVQAETQVAKLKQDIKTLQSQVKALAAENEALRSGDHGLSDIRERTKYASEQLKASAFTAESNLKYVC